MSVTTEHPPEEQLESSAQRLAATMAAVRVSLHWMGVRKTLSPQQRSQAAESFGADGDAVSATKKLLDLRHPALKAVSAVRGRILSYYKGSTLPYPEPGIRLIRRDDIPGFDVQLTTLRAELDEAVAELARCYAELKRLARRRLGSLYNEADYPASLDGLFAVVWDLPSLQPPSYLRQLSPELFAQEEARMRARFEEAVRMAEEAFLSELGKLAAHLTERLSGADDGQPKIFRDSAVTRLHEFFARFGQLNVRSNPQLDQLVAQCQDLVRGIEPQQLRDNETLRRQVATELSAVTSVVDGLLVDRPRRNILRRPR